MQAIDSIVCYVKDLAETLNFYEQILGLTVAYKADWMGMAVMNVGDVKLCLHQFDKIPGNAGQEPKFGHGPVVTFRVDDIQKKYQDFKAQNVTFTSPIIDIPIGKIVYFTDPAGNPLAMMQHN